MDIDDIDIDMSGLKIYDPDPEEKFRFFKKLPTELKTMIWDYSFEARTVHMYLDEINKDDGLLDLHCIFASDKPLPAALSVCKESRQLALRRYQKLDTDMPFEHEEDLEFSYDQLEVYHRIRVRGHRNARVNFDLDTVLITGINLDPIWSWFLATHSIKNLALDLVDADDPSYIVDPKWKGLARRFPNLKNLNLVFGEGCYIPGKRSAELSQIEFPLLPMDSNIEDLFHHKWQLTLRKFRYYPFHDLSLYVHICSRATSIKESLRAFLAQDTAPQEWVDLMWEATFLADTKFNQPLAVRVGHVVEVDNLQQLPTMLRERHKDSQFPKNMFASWSMGDGVEDLYSRYDGLQLLFGEVSPLFRLEMVKASPGS
ncbi:uncharacterized protein PAC_13578 [Phialocephala subalpina]|uniref:2EXR domain-containing protein n=1 Tax=Phialocephala subalpina TaxID=576137 RepID=A0A1L7XF75_9HELO|nr:uncharacterized protein PAC_13578 [Phialocephala subalpina]